MPGLADERLTKFTRTTGAPSRLARLEFSDLERGDDVYAAALDRIAEVSEDLRAGRTSVTNVVVTGAFGSGKTRIAIHLLWDAYAHLLPRTYCGLDFPRFFTAREVAELRFKAYSGPEDAEDHAEEARDALRLCPFVVIDDVGRIAGYKGEELYVEAVIEKRYENDLGTVLTFNELPTEGRFADFLKYFEEVALGGQSHRG